LETEERHCFSRRESRGMIIGWKAQKDIKKKARGNNKVDSMEEWFRYNLDAE
jgi:hypothetical protein